jgi:hypothetical protein
MKRPTNEKEHIKHLKDQAKNRCVACNTADNTMLDDKNKINGAKNQESEYLLVVIKIRL